MRNDLLQRCVVVLSFLSSVALAGAPEGSAPVGEPVPGLTEDELAKFLDGKKLFQHEFTVEEGLGPLFRERACTTCHEGPAVGGFDPQGNANNVTHYTITKDEGDVFQAFEIGGPVQQHRSIAADGSACRLPPDTIPTGMHGIGTSSRHSSAVFGFGLLDAIPDAQILEYEGRQSRRKAPGVYGAANWGVELEGLGPLFAFHLDGTRTQPIGAPRVGRFGWKAPTPTLFQFTTEPFNIELGVSGPFFPRENHPFGDQLPPECLLADAQPNDVGSQDALSLYYFQAFLAAPDRGPHTARSRAGEEVFDKVACADCHRKSFTTGDYYVPLPDGTPHKVAALSNKRIEPYSDLLIHDMGDALADPRPQGRASGRMWRTTPLWGLRHKTHLLHNGSVTTIDAAIRAHGGEGTWSKQAYERLSSEDREALLEFLKTL